MDEMTLSKRAVFVYLFERQCAFLCACIFLIFSLLNLSACVTTNGLGLDLDKRIEQWAENDEYGKALSAINRVDKSDPRFEEFQLKGQKILLQAKRFETTVIAAGKKEMRRNDWNAVLNRYDAALIKFPTSKRLKKEHARVFTKQRVIIQKAEKKVLFAKGEMLDKEIGYNRELSQVDPRNKSIKAVLKSKSEEAKIVSGDLLTLAEGLLAENKLNEAKKLIKLAYTLDASERAGELKTKVLVQIKNKNKLRRSAKKSEKARKARRAKKRALALASDFDKQLLKKEYAEARKTLSLLKKSTWALQGIDKKEALLDERIVNHIDARLKVGYSYYKKENYQKALKIWQNALVLQPSHKQTKDYITRVEKVIGRLEVLKVKRANQE